MTHRQYKNIIKRLGLSQVKAGKFLGVSCRTSQRWATNDFSIPVSVEKLLRVMIKFNLKPDDVNKL